MGNLVDLLPSNHPLVGVWQGDDEDARAQYTITVLDGRFVVNAIDAIDGEVFEVSNIKWDSKNGFLSFDSYMSSTERLGHTTFRQLNNDSVEVTFTFTDRSLWVRVNEVN